MKNLIIILIALIAFNSQAQENNKASKKGEKQSFMKDLSPKEQAALRTKKMTLQYDLSEAQQRKIEQMNLELAKERKLRMEERKKRMEQLKGQKPSKEERLKMINQRLDKQIATKKKMRGILNEKQYEKWEKNRNHKVMKMRNNRKRKGMKRKQMRH